MHNIMTDVFQIYQGLINLERVQSGYMKQVGYLDSLSLLVNNQKVKYPIRHKQCGKINDFQHFCGCLKQIIFAEEELECNQLSLMNLDDLLVAVDHYLIIKSIHRTTNCVTIFSGEPFVKFCIPNISMHNSEKILELYQKVKLNYIREQNFSVKIKQNQNFNKYRQIIYSIICQMDQQKISIPIRFKECKHIDCFDFVRLMMKLQNKQNERFDNKIYCGIIDGNQVCQSWSFNNFDSLANQLVIDFDLMDIIRSLNSHNIYETYYYIDYINDSQIQEIYENNLKQGEEQYGIASCTIFELNISLKLNGRRINYPVNHSDCPNKNAISHICGCLQQILSTQNEIKCGQLSLMNNKKLVSLPDHYYMIRHINQNANNISFYFGLICHKIVRDQRHISLLYEKVFQDLFQKVKLKSTHEYFFQNQIRNILNLNNQQVNGFNAICYIDFVKLSIPMRFKNCHHIECFDFVSFLQRINQNLQQNMKTIKCAVEINGTFCKSECLLDQMYLSEALIIDIELLQIIRNQNQFNNKFFFKITNDQIIYLNEEVSNEITQNILYSQKRNNQQQNQKILDDSLEQVNNIINLQKEESFQNNFSIYMDFKISKYCPLAQAQGIHYVIQQPGRCNNCKQQQCADLKYLVQDFLQQKNNDRESKYVCPLCRQESSKRITNMIPLQIFYHDVNIFKQILRNESQNDQNDYIILKGYDNLLNKFKSEYNLEEATFSEFVIYTQITCIKSNIRLKYPLLILKCPQKSRISFDYFFEVFQNQGYQLNEAKFMIFCECQYCAANKIVNLQQLGFDSIMFQMLQQLPENYDHQNSFIRFNYKTGKISIDQLKLKGVNNQFFQNYFYELKVSLNTLDLRAD
ncbi:hypothetical protein pb186bvf_004481 [Paramecium bursaria]